MSAASPSPIRPARRFRLTLDSWAVLLAATLTFLVALRVIPSVPW